MQAAYRGHLVRKALRGLSDGAKQTALADLRRHKSEHEELKRRNNAALKIQRVARYQLAILEKRRVLLDVEIGGKHVMELMAMGNFFLAEKTVSGVVAYVGTGSHR